MYGMLISRELGPCLNVKLDSFHAKLFVYLLCTFSNVYRKLIGLFLTLFKGQYSCHFLQVVFVCLCIFCFVFCLNLEHVYMLDTAFKQLAHQKVCLSEGR